MTATEIYKKLCDGFDPAMREVVLEQGFDGSEAERRAMFMAIAKVFGKPKAACYYGGVGVPHHYDPPEGWDAERGRCPIHRAKEKSNT